MLRAVTAFTLKSLLRSRLSAAICTNLVPILDSGATHSVPTAPFVKYAWYSTDKNDAVGENEEEEAQKSERDPSKDRSQVIPVETSIRYLESKAYKETYNDKPVWVPYRRNFKGQIVPRTRKTCIRKEMISTGSPCPICRDEYLVLHYSNVKLLKQFICPYTGDVYDSKKTGLCQRQHKNLLVAIQMAKDRGYISFEVPFRKYDYEEFFTQTITH